MRKNISIAVLVSNSKEIDLPAPSTLRVDPDNVFVTLEKKRASGELVSRICGGKICYGSSKHVTGSIEQHLPDGTIRVGDFIDGEFIPNSVKK